LICDSYSYPNASATCIGCAPNRGCRGVQTFPNGALLFDHCSNFRFEGVVSKRLASRFRASRAAIGLRQSAPGWKCDNAERHKLFDGPRQPELRKH
jgi:hypothetical protein